jgi:arabinose-5-phosphate isomerase
MLALADALAVVLMEKKKFTKADYAKFHHGGYLGKKARKEAQRELRV